MSLWRPPFSLLHRCISKNFYNLTISETRNIKRWVSPTLRVLKKRRDLIGPEPEKPRSTYLEWNYDAEIYAFGKRLGEEFDKSLLRRALTQREYANMQEFTAKEKGLPIPEKIDNYELIQEGNEIISRVIKEEYRKLYPEDIVNAVHNYLTSEDMMSYVGSHIGLKDLILTNEFPVAKETLSNTFKAVVAALKHSQDLNRAETFVKDIVLSQMNGKDVYEIWDPQNPYEYLTNLLGERGITAIEPRLCNQSAVNTILANFQVGLYSNKELLGIGWGENVQIARETAALDAIQRIFSNYVPK
ncbi:39S ribosomal protein L44, mitochondrial [Anoplophora glabripennis]|uniref:39S ribosomal protein L44, mitochondrial n=1 Tax=Anoplophora glabripennis TaxID=217634 RepID=UPI0008748605|nr:39S ribosomal protein L44, mitochondrial [Anoplophora glabripennis]